MHPSGFLSRTIKHLTSVWVRAVTVEKNPRQIGRLFSKDAILLGTVSTTYRRGRDSIAQYFHHFANLPNLEAVSRIDNVSRISSSVYVNNSLIGWTHSGVREPIQARMTFIYRKEKNRWVIFELHSSVLPNRKLRPPCELDGQTQSSWREANAIS